MGAMDDTLLPIRPDLIRVRPEPVALRMEVVADAAPEALADPGVAPRPQVPHGLTVALDPDWRRRVLGERDPSSS